MSKNVVKIIKNLSLGSIFGIFFVILIFVFIIKNTNGIRGGVVITVSGIENGLTYKIPVIEVSGNAKHAKSLTIAGKSVPVGIDGDYSTHIVLAKGLNVISFVAEDNFGDITTITYTVYEDDVVQTKEIIN